MIGGKTGHLRIFCAKGQNQLLN